MSKWKWRFEFKLQDMWIGAFWSNKRRCIYQDIGPPDCYQVFDLYICFIPCFPLHFWKITNG